jgi:hypothetical protein
MGDLTYHWWTGPGRGRVNQNTDDAIREANRLFRASYPNVPLPRMTQGGMFGLGGGAEASAGTHDGGGVDDVIPDGMTRTQILFYVTCRRLVGFASWFRPFVAGLWPDHIHSVRIGDDSLSKGAYNQTVDFKKGLTGLASKRKDTLHKWVGWTTWEIYSKDHDKPVSEFFAMAGKHRESRMETVINPGVTTVLPIDDEGNVSLLAGPVSDFYVGANIRIANLPAGAILRLYLSTWDYRQGSPSEMISKGLQAEFVGNTGNTYAGVSFDGEIGKSSKSGWSRRLRLLAETDSYGIGDEATEKNSPVTVTRLVTTVRK